MIRFTLLPYGASAYAPNGPFGTSAGGTIEATGETMRLTCPKCAAQYEVPEAAIPAAGREVQCSDCDAVWFQERPGPVAPAPGDAAGATATAEDPPPGPETAPAPQRQLDPAVADILRAEADRERSARAAEAAGAMPAEAAAAPNTGDTSRSAQDAHEISRRPATTAPSQTGGAAPGPDPSPQIEDVVASPSPAHAARASLAPGTHDDTSPARRGRGFRTGFLLAVLASGTALAAYIFEAEIARLVPAAEQGLARYVETLDTARTLLADTVEDLLARL
jgi:predicted Zn finger-like uncharacterized protein